MKASALTLAPPPAEQLTPAKPVAAPPVRLRANSSCLVSVARFLIWATRKS